MIKTLLTFLTLFITSLTYASHAIIVDAGSSGSRLYLFQYDTSAKLPVISDIFFEDIKPGLSAFADKPNDAGVSLKKLFDDVTQKLIEAHIDPHTVSVSVLGTAGMRMLKSEMQEKIYSNVKQFIQSNYAFQVNHIETISGQKESLYGWLDINYLMKNFQQKTPTVGSLDMGGASTEISFAVEHNAMPEDVIALTIGGEPYAIFSKSFEGLGEDQSIKYIQQQALGYTCYPNHFPLKDTTVGQFNLSSCKGLYADFLQQQHVHESIILPPKEMKFVATSGIYYNYAFLNNDSNPDVVSVENHIQNFCANTWEQMQKYFPKVPAKYLQAYCANGSYLDDLLYNTYQLQGSQLIVTDKIAGQPVDWTLGALLYELSTHA